MRHFGLKHYKAPTPWALRRLGDAILASLGGSGALLAALGTIFTPQSPVVAIAGAVLAFAGMVGKFLTNLYADAQPPTPKAS